MHPAEEHDLAVEVVGLDRTGPPGQALPRRPARAATGRRRHPTGSRRRGGRRPPRGSTTSMPAAASTAAPSVPARWCTTRAVGVGTAQRVDRVAEVVEELPVLPPHDVGARHRLEGGGRERRRDRLGRASGAVREATDVEDAGDAVRRAPPPRRARGAARGTPRTRRTRRRTGAAPRARWPRRSARTPPTIDAGAVAASALSASPVCWLFIAMSTTSSSRKSSPAGCDTTGIDSVRGSRVGDDDAEPVVADRVVVLAARDEHDLVSGVGQPAAHHPTDRAGAVHHESHEPHSRTQHSAGTTGNSRETVTPPPAHDREGGGGSFRFGVLSSRR